MTSLDPNGRWRKFCACGARIRNHIRDVCPKCARPDLERVGWDWDVFGIVMTTGEVAELCGVELNTMEKRICSGTKMLAPRLRAVRGGGHSRGAR